ncbi:hypothetical protein L2E82_43861 [Cichorium intybus]|uniref:Uncharacterized protein n=1 Tax=Cichorium intybus TaxID=13427 RepID=A0ACB8ZP68_CICIN|nr:hypothetical protein L2E82_43861 [Cichorium intybus]
MRKEIVVGASVATVATVVVAGVLLVRWKKRDERRWRQTQRILRRFARDCATPVPKLWHVAFDLVSDMQTSLSDQSQTDFVMLPSYTSSLPNGNEEGLYYGVNLREDNFLLLRARLRGKNEPITDLQREEVDIPAEVIAGTLKELFNYIALKLSVFISTNTQTDPITPKGKLGFTVSFPLLEGPAAATNKNVIRWKSFSVNDAVGKDLAHEINEALEKHGIELRVSALVDATLGDLAGGRYYNRESVAAVTLGLATNAVYVESAQLSPNAGESKLGEMIAYTSPAVREVVAEICDVVAERGARLAGACIVGIMKKRGRINDKKSLVIIEGGLYEHYRVFRNYLHSSVWEMLGSELSDNVVIEHSHGGSGAGAIFVAAAHSYCEEDDAISPSFVAAAAAKSKVGDDVGKAEIEKDEDRKYLAAVENDDDDEPVEWKDDQMETASWKGDHVDSTAETSDQTDSSEE